jgi:hypothetical protein
MRRPDKPGTWRATPKGGRFLVSGVTTEGERVKVYAATREKADALGKSIFGGGVIPDGIGPIPSPQPSAAPQLDEWGFPIRITPDVAASINASFGVKPGPTTSIPTTPPAIDKDEQEKRERRAKHAKSVMELVGVGYAGGTVMVAKKWVRATRNNEPVKVNPKQVNDLADSTRDTLIEFFGDRDIKPWHMMLLLTMGIPLSMWLQTEQKPKVDEKEPAKLKSVP